jgi:Major Facilitator Superfamily
MSTSSLQWLVSAYVLGERTAPEPLIRLGILRSGSLVRANLGAMSLFGGWVGFQFVLTLYLQQLRGWSALETGLAILPAGMLVTVASTRMAWLIGRFGVTRLIVTGLVSLTAAYALFLPIGLHSSYALGMLPTFLLAGTGFALAFGPLNVAATNGVAAHEQGLAGGLLNTSFQFGGALVLAIVTAVNNAFAGSGGTAQGTLDGYHAAIFVSLGAAVLGIVAMTRRARTAEIAAPLEQIEAAAAEAMKAA